MNLNLKKLDLRFVEEENGKPCHKHILNSKEVPGCTSISGLFQDDGWKFAWPVKLMAEIVIREVNERILDQADQGLCLGQIEPICARAKNAWREKRSKSADSGQKAHAEIEKYIKTGAVPFLVEPEVQHCFDQFLRWEEVAKPKWLASEIQVGSETHKFAGILDAVAEIDGKLVLVDFKTSSGIKKEYNIQLAGLMICLEEMCLEEMGCVPEQRAILWLPKDGKYEYVSITSNLEYDKQAFLAGLEFYKYKNILGGK